MNEHDDAYVDAMLMVNMQANARSVTERVGTNVDGRATLEARQHDRDEAESRRYRPRRGGRYDPDHDRSTSPEPPGPRVFSEAIRSAKFPARFRQPANLANYSGETDPDTIPQPKYSVSKTVAISRYSHRSSVAINL